MMLWLIFFRFQQVLLVYNKQPWIHPLNAQVTFLALIHKSGLCVAPTTHIAYRATYDPCQKLIWVPFLQFA